MPTPVQSGTSTPTVKPPNLPATSTQPAEPKRFERSNGDPIADSFRRTAEAALMLSTGTLGLIGKGISDWKRNSAQEQKAN